MHTLPLHVTEPLPPICTSHPVLTSAQEGRGVGVALAGAGTELEGAGTELEGAGTLCQPHIKVYDLTFALASTWMSCHT
jgi:hypothetical protein